MAKIFGEYSLYTLTLLNKNKIPNTMNTSTTSSSATMPLSNENVNILDVLRVIGMKEVANNVFTLPKKKK